jgi:hypothetical protein
MSNGKTTLTIRSGAFNDPDWQNTNSHDGQEYAYRFDGPSVGDHKGKGRFKSALGFPPGKNPKKVYDVDLVSADENNRYEIDHVDVRYGGSQFTVGSFSKYKAQLDNANSGYQQGFYCIVVKDTLNNDGLIDCDPMITNDPH